MKNDPTLSQLFKLENAQLEKFLALDFELLYTKPDNTPALKDTCTQSENRHRCQRDFPTQQSNQSGKLDRRTASMIQAQPSFCQVYYYLFLAETSSGREIERKYRCLNG
jgi:hypothetical protein